MNRSIRVTFGSALMALGLLLQAGVAPVAAHDPAIDIAADHAFAADPLYSLETGSGLWSRLPDQVTAMGSTTKIMTLHLAVRAVATGAVAMSDWVVISANASAPCPNCSLMTADNGATLQLGERVKFEDLLYGLMMDSGNDAAVAIAEHVAKGIHGSASVAFFVDDMNDRADALGLTATNFMNPSGVDSQLNGTALHFTTARELAQLWEVGMTSATFRQIVGAASWTATSRRANGTNWKTYTMGRTLAYPGIEGHKNGGTPLCSGDFWPAAGCFIASASRLGRRLVVAGMQADEQDPGNTTGDGAELFDLGYFRMFHPDPRGASPLGPVATRHSLTCPASTRAVDAVMPITGAVRLVRWSANVNTQAYSIAATRAAPSGSLATTSSSQSRDVDLVMPSSSRAVTASRVGNTAELRLWAVPASGSPSAIGAGVRIDGVKSIKLAVLRSGTVVAAILTTGGDVVLRSIGITTRGLSAATRGTMAIDGDIAELDVNAARDHAEMRFVVAARRNPSGTTIQSWRLTSAGQFQALATANIDASVLGVSVIGLRRSAPADELFVPERYAIVGRYSLGIFNQVYAVPSATGALVPDGFRGVAGTFSQVDAAAFGPGGLLTVSKSGSSTKLIVWEASGGEIRPVSDHTVSGPGADLRACAVASPLATTDAIVASRDGLGSVTRLRGFRIGDRPAP